MSQKLTIILPKNNHNGAQLITQAMQSRHGLASCSQQTTPVPSTNTGLQVVELGCNITLTGVVFAWLEQCLSLAEQFLYADTMKEYQQQRPDAADTYPILGFWASQWQRPNPSLPPKVGDVVSFEAAITKDPSVGLVVATHSGKVEVNVGGDIDVSLHDYLVKVVGKTSLCPRASWLGL